MFAAIIFASLINGSDKCKTAAIDIHPTLSLTENTTPPSEDEDPPQTLIATVAGWVALGLRAKSQLRDQHSPEAIGEAVEWDRVVASYLSVLSIWCWDNPEGVKEVLEEGGVLGVVS